MFLSSLIAKFSHKQRRISELEREVSALKTKLEALARTQHKHSAAAGTGLVNANGDLIHLEQRVEKLEGKQNKYEQWRRHIDPKLEHIELRVEKPTVSIRGF